MLKLAGIFQDNMVIQRNKPIQVWGTGTPGAIVTVSLFTATADTMVCADGSWKIALQPLCAGAGYTLVASDTADSKCSCWRSLACRRSKQHGTGTERQ